MPTPKPQHLPQRLESLRSAHIDRKVIEQALEALNHGITEMNHRGCAIECMPLHHANKALREALAHPQPVQQEPVGWIDAKALEELEKQEMNWMPVWNRQNGTSPIALYTSPQAAHPLSDERLCEAMRKAADELLDHIYEFSTISEGVNPRLLAVGRSIEQAHGITKGTT